MYLTKAYTYKGIALEAAVFKIQTITIQDNQLDFYVAIKTTPTSETLEGETHGCAYDAKAGTPEAQAYAYLKTLESYTSAETVTEDTTTSV